MFKHSHLSRCFCKVDVLSINKTYMKFCLKVLYLKYRIHVCYSVHYLDIKLVWHLSLQDELLHKCSVM